MKIPFDEKSVVCQSSTVMETTTPIKAAKAAIRKSTTLFPDKVTTSKGVLRVRRTYFYRHGQTAQGWADLVTMNLQAAGLSGFTVEAHDDWARWPRDSYFTAEVSFPA